MVTNELLAKGRMFTFLRPIFSLCEKESPNIIVTYYPEDEVTKKPIENMYTDTVFDIINTTFSEKDINALIKAKEEKKKKVISGPDPVISYVPFQFVIAQKVKKEDMLENLLYFTIDEAYHKKNNTYFPCVVLREHKDYVTAAETGNTPFIEENLARNGNEEYVAPHTPFTLKDLEISGKKLPEDEAIIRIVAISTFKKGMNYQTEGAYVNHFPNVPVFDVEDVFPEAFQKDKVCPVSDIYSLEIVPFETANIKKEKREIPCIGTFFEEEGAYYCDKCGAGSTEIAVMYDEEARKPFCKSYLLENTSVVTAGDDNFPRYTLETPASYDIKTNTYTPSEEGIAYKEYMLANCKHIRDFGFDVVVSKNPAGIINYLECVREV